jgi:hypothetical protein
VSMGVRLNKNILKNWQISTDSESKWASGFPRLQGAHMAYCIWCRYFSKQKKNEWCEQTHNPPSKYVGHFWH